MQLTCDGDTTKSKPCLDIQDVFHSMRRGKDHGIGNEPILVAFDRPDHGSLRRRTLIMMYDTNATKELKSKTQTQIALNKAPFADSCMLTAIAIAISPSVTVSIGLLMNGVLSTTFLVIRLSITTSDAGKSILPGRSKKSL